MRGRTGHRVQCSPHESHGRMGAGLGRAAIPTSTCPSSQLASQTVQEVVPSPVCVRTRCSRRFLLRIRPWQSSIVSAPSNAIISRFDIVDIVRDAAMNQAGQSIRGATLNSGSCALLAHDNAIFMCRKKLTKLPVSLNAPRILLAYT